MIKSKKNPSRSRQTYPKLMTSQVCPDAVVLFTTQSEGMVVVGSSRYFLGEYSKTWNMNKFNDYNGSVTLENE